MKVFTFWEGTMPSYIELCLRTWKVPFTILTYENLHNYTDLSIEPLQRFTMPQIADCVRVHVLRDNGGYWLDADTIMLTDRLPQTNMVGYPDSRMNTIGFLHTEKDSAMYKDWAIFQESVIKRFDIQNQWNIMGNAFTDKYVKAHPEISIADVTKYWPETYVIDGKSYSRYDKYKMFYFETCYHLTNIRQTDMLMLHNSWTPDWYKDMSFDSVFNDKRTMSNLSLIHI